MVSGLNPTWTQTIIGSRWLACPALLAFVSCLLTSGAYAQEACPEPVGRFASIEGEARVMVEEGGALRNWISACARATPYVWETAVVSLSS